MLTVWQYLFLFKSDKDDEGKCKTCHVQVAMVAKIQEIK